MLRHLPNALSGLRMFAAPALAFLLLHGWFQSAFALFLIAAMSDAVDGYLAKDGKPLADGSMHANSRQITTADGRKVFVGSSADNAK